MNKIMFAATTLALATTMFGGCATPERSADTLRVASYNIRYNNPKEKPENAWPVRRDALVETIRNMDLDVFGMQEVQTDMRKFLSEKLPDYAIIGEHSGKPDKPSSSGPIAYRVARFDLEDSGTFWLSTTPEVRGSRSWKSFCVRICTYAILKDKATGKRLCFANTHLDHRSTLAREKGMELVLQRMKTFAKGCPVILTGDHNCTELSKPVEIATRELDNAFFSTETPPRGSWRSFNGWRWRDEEFSAVDALKLTPEERNARPSPLYERCGGSRIDYIYVSRGVRVLDYETVNAPRKGLKLYPSDHFPVVATIKLR